MCVRVRGAAVGSVISAIAATASVTVPGASGVSYTVSWSDSNNFAAGDSVFIKLQGLGSGLGASTVVSPLLFGAISIASASYCSSTQVCRTSVEGNVIVR